MSESETTTLPLLPLRHGVVLPGVITPIPVGRKRSRELAAKLKEGDRFVLGVQFDSAVMQPGVADLHPLAVVAKVHDTRIQARGAIVLAEAVERVRIVSLRDDGDSLEVDVIAAKEDNADTAVAVALADSLRGLIEEHVEDEELEKLIGKKTPPGLVADRVAMRVDIDRNRKAEVLHALDVEQRLRLVAELFHEARAEMELRAKIDSEVREGLNKNQREALLRQRLRAIQKELGEDGDDQADELRSKLEAMDLPEEARKVVDRELKRLDGQGPEAQVRRRYLELIAELPWSSRAEARQDIDAVARALDADHHGLDDVKQRILEHMAVLALTKASSKGTILALVGPPGVGKTSLAQSVADATGRPLARVSLGGVRDEAEVRGHRRTYVGALPGRIIAALAKTGVKNPVMVLDEIDKLGRGWAGDPEAALLEVLDPEQNHTFTDHYLEIPFDLSEVLFIATANDLSTLSPPLRDRLEIIELSGYTLQEKVAIARDHLWPKKLVEHGLEADELEMPDALLETAVREYTREAGVRQLTRELAKVCRSVALERARGKAHEPLSEARLRGILGRPRFFDEPIESQRPAGVAAGLAWTPVGGDVLYIETTEMPGKGKLEITGQLGEVMNESARAALAYLRSHARELGVRSDILEGRDLHIHVPAGGTPKDGPSAGVTIFTALASLLTGRRVRPDTAMTGEATLRGRVLPVGGIKSKVLAAHRAGLTRVILPHKNERDLDDIPQAIRDELDIILAADMETVLREALEDAPLFDMPDTSPSPLRPSTSTPEVRQGWIG
ncbi:MAG: endopeptidase La [Polyangiaceae bacterium]